MRLKHLTNQLNEFKNKIYLHIKKLNVKKINYEKHEYIDIDIEKIELLYDEANFFFEQKISKRLDEAQSFYKNLSRNKRSSLKIEIVALKDQLDELNKRMDRMSNERGILIKTIHNEGVK